MEAMAQEWTDGRLDDLNKKVDHGFERVDTDMRGLRLEMRTEFAAVNGRLDSLQRTMVQAVVALTAAILTGFVGICGVLVATL
jgi:hypothetical protein